MALWGVKELAGFLGYSEATLARMVSQKPEGLPPRVAALSRPRWDQAVVEQWIKEQSCRRPESRRGRPRNVA
jgi:predicted DNA-binding transcriptional regulator AlpA